MGEALDPEIERLYGLPLESFVAERDRAAQAARTAGDSAGASTIGGLPKPSIAAWAVNQLVRQDRRNVDLLLDSGHRLVEAQRAALRGGDTESLDKARADYDDRVGQLTSAAAMLLEKRATAPTLERVRDTLWGAAITPEGRERLAHGTFTKETSETGWEILATISPERSAARAASRPKKAPVRSNARAAAADTKQADERERAALRAELREARKRRDELARRLAGAERKERVAAAALREAQATLEAARAELERAQAQLDEADAQVSR